MDIISIGTGFVMGILFYRMFQNLFGVTWAILFFKEIEKNSLLMLISVAEAISYIQQIKYNTMVESEVPESTIKLTKNIDQQNFELWKTTVITNLTSYYPKLVQPSYRTWAEALKLLDKIYHRKRT
tara:strand:- start:94 stop:471 length:378 start_codon:yes stop_codon:yes gene_type:complete